MPQIEAKSYQQHLRDTMIVAFFTCNVSAILGSPIDRLKTGVQVELSQPWPKVITNIAREPRNLLAGSCTSLVRQNFKFSYRTLLSTDMAKRIDESLVGMPYEKIVGIMVKSLFSCTFDTTMMTPFEAIKTQLMKTPGVGIWIVSKRIYLVQGGSKGFLNGWVPTFIKSYPSWFNLFFTHHVARNTLKKYNRESTFFTTVLTATCSAIPITILTTPLDVIKTNMQHHLAEKEGQKPSMLTVAKKIVREDGFLKLWRGCCLRMCHRTQNLIVGLIVLNYFNDKH